MKIIKEVCVETYREALFAEQLGADRIELCSSLDQDGLTPKRKTIKFLSKELTIPLKVMIRPRPGNFNYNETELVQMESDILFCKSQGIKEVVLGVLNEKQCVDLISLERLLHFSSPMKITFHKAIDETVNIFEEIEKLVNYKNITSILTSGKGKFVLDNKALLIKIIEQFKNKINIILAGGIAKNNFEYIHNVFQWNEYHGRRIIGNLIDQQ